MGPAHTLYDRIKTRAEQEPESIAILALNRAPLRYDRLRQQIDSVVGYLNQMGLGRNDRIALILPNGPEMAVAVLAVSAGAACVPLSAAQTEAEFEYLFSKMHLQALIMDSQVNSPAKEVAESLGIRVLELSARLDSEAGLFAFPKTLAPENTRATFASPGDIALVLHTSGTTARPKIVPLTQANLCTSAHNISTTLQLAYPDRCINVLPLYHVHGLIGALFSSITAGGSVICTAGFDTSVFFSSLESLNPTWYTAVPTVHQTILASAPDHREAVTRTRLRFVRSSSSSLPRQVAAELESLFGAPVINTYGMTEASHQIASNPLPPGKRKPGSVGRAVGTEVGIIDERGRMLPAGAAGEIVVRGLTITQGYEDEPRPEPSFTADGWFRTGDQGYCDTEGYLFITGRLKEIVNRGGEKIAPLEVDDVLMDHPDVAQAAAFAVAHEHLGEDLVCAVVLKPDASATGVELRVFSSERLAAHKVPSQILIVDEIPKGPTGKLERQALSKHWTAQLKADFAPPRTPTEKTLCGIWEKVLGLGRLGIHDNFFELGGHSLLATQMSSRVRESFAVEIPLRTLFLTPTVAGLAKQIDDLRNAQTELDAPPITPMRRNQELPLSFSQEREWLLDRLEPGTSAYNTCHTVRIGGRLEREALAKSLTEIVRRHESMRTVFPSRNDKPIQVILPAPAAVLPIVDLSSLRQAPREMKMQQLAQAEGRTSFDLARGPLFRCLLIELSEEDRVFCVTMHHIVTDGWSMGVFFGEIWTLYEAFIRGEPSPLPKLTLQYADYAQWQRRWLSGPTLERLVSYWRNQLRDAPQLLELPTDHPRPRVQTFRGARIAFSVCGSVAEKIKVFCRREGATPFMTLLSGFKALLYSYTAQERISVGTFIANRNRVEIEPLIGFFVNNLVLSTDLSGDPSFRELLTRVRTVTLDAYAHQDLPFEKLLEELHPVRNPSCPPLFQVMFVMQNTPQTAAGPAGLTLSPLDPSSQRANFDLTLCMWATGEAFHGSMEYNTDLFEENTVNELVEQYQTLVEQFLREPDWPLSETPVIQQLLSVYADPFLI